MKRFFALFWLCCLLLMQSCAAILQGSRTNLIVSSSNPNAKITYKNEVVGEKGTATVLVRRAEDHQFVVTVPGEEPKTVNFTRKVQGGWIAADIFLAGLVGIIVDAATGAWHRFDGEKVAFVKGSSKGGYKKTVDSAPKSN